MQHPIFYFLAVLGATCFAADSPKVASTPLEAVTELPGWGTATDPDGDCQFLLEEEALSIRVPGAGRPHDLAAEIKVTNAPRVLQPVDGDFVATVRVEGGFVPGSESTKPGRTGYNGAALVAMVDERNVATLARAVLQRRGEQPQPYANFEIRVNGKLERIGMTGDYRLPKEGPVHLRLEVRGSHIYGAVSKDGVSWEEFDAKPIPPEWPRQLKTGVVAISTSKEEFTPRFSKLQVSP